MKIALIATALAGSVLWFSGVLPFSSAKSATAGDVQVLYFPNGREQLRAALQDGVREGPASEWYANGQERCSGSYANGLREGAWSFWNEDGTVDAARTGTYAVGVRTGP